MKNSGFKTCSILAAVALAWAVAISGASAQGGGDPAFLICPADGSALESSTVSFEWRVPSPDITDCDILVVHEDGASWLGESIPAADLWYTVSGLPTDGKQILVTLTSNYSDGSSQSNQYQFSAPQPLPPFVPLVPVPADGAGGVPTSQTLRVVAEDPDAGESLQVTFRGREIGSDLEDFTIAVIPDTQWLSCEIKETLETMMQWIADNAVARNIVYVAHVGDLVQCGDDKYNYSCTNNGWCQGPADPEHEWISASGALSKIEGLGSSYPVEYPFGMPYGIAIGNHDSKYKILGGGGSVITTYSTESYNKYFGTDRFEPMSTTSGGYYGGSYPSGSNDNSYQVFQVGDLGMEFLAFTLKYDQKPIDPGVFTWMKGIIEDPVNVGRRVIVTFHYLLNSDGTPSQAYQQEIYSQLSQYDNFFLMLCGHELGEARRTDNRPGGLQPVYTLLANWQDSVCSGGKPFAGDGYLRLMRFSKSTNTIRVMTYSPTRDQFDTALDNLFELEYGMGGLLNTGTGPWAYPWTSETFVVGNGETVTATWSELEPYTAYEWYVEITDIDGHTVESPRWHFKTSFIDCNGNGIDDAIDISSGTSTDCNGNGIPDECEPDRDGDGVTDNCDNCPDDPNPDQSDLDEDGLGDVCDPDQDGDGILEDGDGNGTPGDHPCEGGNTVGCDDNCPVTPNADQADSDGDVWGDACDNCKYDRNDDQGDLDADGVGDVCDPDIDGDLIPNCYDPLDCNHPCTGGDTQQCDDNCPLVQNPDQEDTEAGGGIDGIGDACEGPDDDGDNVWNELDLCPDTPTGEVVDSNGCSDSQVDEDGDGICTEGAASTGPGECQGSDLCPGTAGGDVDTCGCSDAQVDFDGDGYCDSGALCGGPSACTLGETPCTEGNTVDCYDNCPVDINPDQANEDQDVWGNACDNCRYVTNDDQGDLDDNGVGDVCDEDADGDGIPNCLDPQVCNPCTGGNKTGCDDNCPLIPNPEQEDTAAGGGVDGIGDACEQPDDDGDNVWNDNDRCLNTPPGEAVDGNGCSDSQVDSDGDGVCNEGAASGGPSGCLPSDGDQCPGTAAGDPVDTCGCSDAQVDSDGDGACDDPQLFCYGPSVCTGVDECPDDPEKSEPGQCGCGTPDTDTDEDGVADCNDLCADTAAGEPVDGSGCADSQVDEDSDGVCDQGAPSGGPSQCPFDGDAYDLCPDTPTGAVDLFGCSDPQVDGDGDGYCDPGAPSTGPGVCETGAVACGDGNTSNCYDNCPIHGNPSQLDTDGDSVGEACDLCPGTLPGHDVDANGCSDAQVDTDHDTVLDEGAPSAGPLLRTGVDLCPGTAAGDPADPNGCSDAQVDTDGDGVCDPSAPSGGPGGCTGVDNCPTDPGKVEPGVCGCGVADTDSDGDGTVDCVDACPGDPFKVAPGICGCGVADDDSDGNGVIDCLEGETSFQRIGEMGGGVSRTRIWGNRGVTNAQIAVGRGNDGGEGSGFTAFRWQDGTFVGLPRAGAGPYSSHSWAYGVSADGSVVYGYDIDAGAPVVWTDGGGGWANATTVLLNGGDGWGAISADGAAIVDSVGGVAYRFTTSDGWATAGGVTRTVLGGMASARGCSGDGSIVVGASAVGPAIYGGPSASGTVTLPGSGEALAVSDDGTVVTGVSLTNAYGKDEPCKWVYSDGAWTQTILPLLPGMVPKPFQRTGTALAVSADGRRIAGHFRQDGDYYVPLVWDSYGVRTLESMLNDDGVFLDAGWYLADLGAMSPDGKTFGGSMSDQPIGSADNNRHAWTATLGEGPDDCGHFASGFESAAGWTYSAYGPFPGTSEFRATWGTANEHSGSYGLGLSNQVYAKPTTDYIAAGPGTHDVSAWVRGEMEDSSYGGWIVRAYFYDSGYQALSPSWQDASGCAGNAGCLSATWSEKSGTVEAPAGTAYVTIRLLFYMADGWATFDDVELDGQPLSVAEHGVDGGFETDTGWNMDSVSSFPATSIYRSTWGTASPHSGSYALNLSNHAYAQPITDFLATAPGAHTISAWVRGEMEDSSQGGWIVRAYFYDDSYQSLSPARQNAASCTGYASCVTSTWTQKSGTVEAPAGTAYMRIRLYFYMASGWVAYDDVALDGTPLTVATHGVDGGFETDTGWSFSPHPWWPATSVYHGTSGTADGHGGDSALALSNQTYAYPVTEYVCAHPGTYEVSAWMRGEMSDSSARGWLIRANFYDAAKQRIGFQDAGSCTSGTASCLSAAWSQKTGIVQAPAGTESIRVQVYFYLAGGWLDLDDVKVRRVE